MFLPYSWITLETISLENPMPMKWLNTLELAETADELALRGRE